MTAEGEPNIQDVAVAEALWRLGLLRSEQLPNVAISLLESGVDSRSLRILAATPAHTNYEAVALLEQALRELNKGRMSKRDAALVYAKWIASRIVNNELHPLRGAALIADAALRVDDPGFHDLDPFVYAASESEDRPEDRDMFSRAIAAEARRILSMPCAE